jgi:uncharacterized protein
MRRSAVRPHFADPIAEPFPLSRRTTLNPAEETSIGSIGSSTQVPKGQESQGPNDAGERDPIGPGGVCGVCGPGDASDPVAVTAQRLIRAMADLVPCVVAFSGGVDSAVVAAAAARADQVAASADQATSRADRAVGGRSVAVTAFSPAVPMVQREIALRVAKEIGIEHRVVETGELSIAEYSRNDTRRCFFCKQTLYQALDLIAAEAANWDRGQASGAGESRPIVSGTNADDLGDYRPGIEAGRQVGVRTPLADLGIGKADVRRIAARWGLSVAELPAAPCLASRVAYGVEVTQARLKMIEGGEAWLAARGFSPLRVRLHPGEMARIEVAPQAIADLVRQPLLDDLNRHFSRLGFRAVTVDLAGFRSGSLNQLVSIHRPAGSTR